MRSKRIYALITLVFYLAAFATPAISADGAAAQTTSAISSSAQTNAVSFGDALSSGQSAVNGNQNQTDANINASNIFTGSSDAADTQNTVTEVNETLDAETVDNAQETKKAGTAANENADAINPRDVLGSTMFNNLGGGLRRFGDDFFAQVRTNSLTYAPVGPNYIVAPGDQVKVTVWGFNEIRANMVVDRDGMIALPQAGVIQAAGVTFEDLRKNIETAYKKIFTDFDIDVSMGKLHTINVYVAGSAKRPGAYAVSSMATVIDILSQAGGPSSAGSMRNIEIKRGTKKIAGFDVYRLLLHGDRKGDVRLRDGDIIFIRPVGRLVSVAGNVKRPAIYELSDKAATLEDAIRLAGGLTSGASKDRIQVVRVEDNTYRMAFEDALNASAKKMELHDGDLIKIFAVYGSEVNVRITGAVVQPGTFAIEDKKTTLRDVISRAGGLIYTASSDAELTRIEVGERGPVTTRKNINIRQVMEGKANITLQRDDYVFVKTIPDWEVTRSATVDGRVLHPGNYAVKRGERLSSLLERSGGYADGAFVRGAVFMRNSVRIEQQKAIDDMLRRLEREFAAASNEAISTAANTKDKDFALAEIEQKRRLLDAMRDAKATGRLIISLPEKLSDLKDSVFDIELKEGDTIAIPEHPNTVQVVGAVTAQSAFIYQPGLRVADYIELAGGYSSSANVKKSYVIKPNGSITRVSKDTKIEEGDYIVIPEKMVFKQRLRSASDILDLLSKTVMSIASVHYIFK